MLGHLSGAGQVAGSVLLDNFIFSPCIFLPSFYVAKEVLMNSSSTPRAGLERYHSEFYAAVTQTVAIWVPAHLITFSMVPMHLRCPWTVLVSGGHLAAMLISNNNKSGAAVAAAAAAAAGASGSAGMTVARHAATAADEATESAGASVAEGGVSLTNVDAVVSTPAAAAAAMVEHEYAAAALEPAQAAS